MKLRNMTIDELLDLEQELLTDSDLANEPIGRNHQIISVYEELYRKISKDKEGEYADLEPMIKKHLVSFLVRHGSYLKTEYKKDDRAAESTLKKALTYDRQIPIAHYRLGFLAYKQKNYLQALLHFKNAHSYNRNGDNKQFLLTNQQNYHAQIYIANSSLHIAKAAQEIAARLEEETDVLTVPSQNLSPLYELIAKNEKLIEQNAYKIITEEGEKLCSKEHAEDLLDSEKHKIILYFSDRENMLLFSGKSKPLTTKQAELLRYFFLYTSNQHPATKHHVYDLYEGTNDNGEMPTNTYTQWIARLKEKLTQCHIPATIINNTRYRNQTAYFFEKNWPFLIIHRSDDTFILKR